MSVCDEFVPFKRIELFERDELSLTSYDWLGVVGNGNPPICRYDFRDCIKLSKNFIFSKYGLDKCS